MYSIIVIEDEFIIKNALVNDINWSTINCEVVGETDNGDQAIEIIKMIKPDIVISDIKIYGKSGIEVCEYIHEYAPKTKTILLTGYGEIEYAKAAIKYGVKDFILKPSSPEEIIASVKKIVKDIDRIREKEEELISLQKTVQRQISFLKNEFYIGNDSIIYFGDTGIAKNENHTNYLKYFSVIAESVVVGNSSEVYESFNFVSLSLMKVDSLGISYYKSIMAGLIVTIQTKLEDNGINIEDILASNILSELLECQCVEDINVFVKKVIEQMIKYIKSINKKRNIAIISKIEQYLIQNYDKHIMLEDLGKAVYMNPKYVCRLIKKETGENFTEILNKIRVNKAKELMQNIKYKTYEISDLVGIGNSRYFSQMFKKYTGMTPSEYKNKIGNKSYTGGNY